MGLPTTSPLRDAYDAIYPPNLRLAEIACIKTRRARAAGHLGAAAPETEEASDLLPQDTVGLALAGGGLRSAAFCLGVMQALAAGGLIRRIDFLSTVSGGGYLGGFLGALINRAAPLEDGGAVGVERAERDLIDDRSFALGWLREHGRSFSALTSAAFMHKWLTIQIVMATIMLALMGIAATLRTVDDRLWVQQGRLWWSPYLAIAASVLVFACFPLGWSYWLIQRDKRISRTFADRVTWITVIGVFLTSIFVVWRLSRSADHSGAHQFSSRLAFWTAVSFGGASLLAVVFFALASRAATFRVLVERERYIPNGASLDVTHGDPGRTY